MTRRLGVLAVGLWLAAAAPAQADQLYDGRAFARMASDAKADAVGDILTVIIYESASATNRVGTRSAKSTDFDAGVAGAGTGEAISLGIDNRFRGMGETERSDRFVASMAARVVEILPNGDLIVVGTQNLLINGERRDILIRGQVRRIDISPSNTVPSSRLADAEINYDGKGYVTRSAKPGLINRIFSFLGL